MKIFYPNKLFALIIFFGLGANLFSQGLPTYQERSLTDTTLIFESTKLVSEGAVNPDEYKVGPGDEFIIVVSGVQETTVRVKIDPEGFLYIPRSGVIDLRYKTLTETKELITKQLDKSFRNADYYISLVSFRNISVSLIGNVRKPSTYVLFSNSRLLDLIKSSLGLTPSSDLRNIVIQSKDDTKKSCDFLSFLRKGDFSQNPYLKEGDVVLIQKVNKMVIANGQVLYPAQYEFKEDETIYDLINLAGGLSYKARKDSIELIRFATDGETQFSLFFSYNQITSEPIKLQFGDQIIVRSIPDYYISQYVTITGKVKYPGLYKIIKNKTSLTEIVNKAGGFLEDASLVDATVFRVDADSVYDPEFERIKLIPRADMTDDEYDYFKSKSRQRVGKVIVDFQKLFIEGKATEDIVLRRQDQINIPEKKNYITIIGQVVKPGNIIYDPKLSVSDYIQIAGGFSWRALEGDVRVIKVNTGEWVDADDVKTLDPGDSIWVLENPPGPKFWEIFMTTLTILGQVAAVVAATVAVIIAVQ